MPEMNGIELLKEVKKLQPETVRLLLTGYADKENAIKAINEVGLYHYLEKPWDNDALLNIVRNALEEKGLKRALATKVDELDTLLSRHGELEAKHRFLEKELEMAAKVQRSLLPTEFPKLAGFRFANLYQPCEAIGGDFFDVIAKGAHEDAAILLVSDVIGHGVQAALTTMLLKGVFQEAASDSDIVEPVDLLKEMNRRLYAVLPSGMYAAAAVFYLSSESPEISFANAGAPLPVRLAQQRTARRRDRARRAAARSVRKRRASVRVPNHHHGERRRHARGLGRYRIDRGRRCCDVRRRRASARPQRARWKRRGGRHPGIDEASARVRGR